MVLQYHFLGHNTDWTCKESDQFAFQLTHQVSWTGQPWMNHCYRWGCCLQWNPIVAAHPPPSFLTFPFQSQGAGNWVVLDKADERYYVALYNTIRYPLTMHIEADQANPSISQISCCWPTPGISGVMVWWLLENFICDCMKLCNCILTCILDAAIAVNIPVFWNWSCPCSTALR